MKLLILSFIGILTIQLAFSNENLPNITLENEKGGRLDGTSWSSAELKGKVFALFYVDPDEKDLNEFTADLMFKENFSLDKYGSVGVINMAATWLPNFAIATSLKQKQKKFPTTLYLKDFKKVLVKEWGLKDDSSNIVIFDKNGKVLIKVLGKATTEEAHQIIKIIKENLDK